MRYFMYDSLIIIIIIRDNDITFKYDFDHYNNIKYDTDIFINSFPNIYVFG